MDDQEPESAALRRAEHWLAMQYAVTKAMAGSSSISEMLRNLLPQLARGTGWELGEVWLINADRGALKWACTWHDTGLDIGDFETISRLYSFGRGEGVPGLVWERCAAVYCADVSTDPQFLRQQAAARCGLRTMHAFPIFHADEILGVVTFFSREAIQPDSELRRELEAIGQQIGDYVQHRRTEDRLRELDRRSRERQQQAELGAFTAQIVHDLGNPLAGLSMLVHAIQRMVTGEASLTVANLRPLAMRLDEEIGHLCRILADLGQFVRGQALDYQPLDLTDLLRTICDTWILPAAASGCSLSTDLVDQAVIVRADADQLRRVFDNLIKNAIEALDTGEGSVRVSSTIEADRVCVSIEDSGGGVAEGINIFGLFETTKPGGTGLGLPICQQLIARHRGHIEYAPLKPRGSVFRVDLPRAG